MSTSVPEDCPLSALRKERERNLQAAHRVKLKLGSECGFFKDNGDLGVYSGNVPAGKLMGFYRWLKNLLEAPQPRPVRRHYYSAAGHRLAIEHEDFDEPVLLLGDVERALVSEGVATMLAIIRRLRRVES